MKKILSAVILVSLIIGITACQKKQLLSSPLDKNLERIKAPAVIAITPEKGIVPFSVDGQAAKPCIVKRDNNTDPKDLCPASRPNAKIISRKKIEIIESEGSICYTFYDMTTHKAFQLCVPEP